MDKLFELIELLGRK